jgi:GAF domain-containing protein
LDNLAHVASSWQQGNLEQPLMITGRDEIGALARAFNAMAAQLRDLIESLETRVADRTRALETSAEVSRRLSTILDLNQLLAEVVNQIQESFGYYYAHLYLLDRKAEKLVMAAGTGQAGAEMKAQGHYIPLDAQISLVAKAARTGEIVRGDNVRETQDWLPNPLLPDTYSEMAVPIILDGQVVGVLDVQENKIAGLDESDASLLRALANQVAVAIRNARLFAQAEKALAEAQASQEYYLTEAWERTKLVPQSREHLYLRSDASTLPEATQIRAKQQALKQQRPAIVEVSNDSSKAKSIVAPVILGGEPIGALQLHQIGSATKAQPWTEQDLALIEAVLDQVAQTAENLRLFEETRERASRESTIREITERMRAATSLEELVKTTAHELGQRLSAGRAVVALGLEPETPGLVSDSNQSNNDWQIK